MFVPCSAWPVARSSAGGEGSLPQTGNRAPGGKLTRMLPTRSAVARGVGGAFLAVLWLGTGAIPQATTPVSVQDDDGDDEGLGPSPRYDELREARLTHAGRIHDGRLRIDRFELELEDGHLYLAPEIDGVVSTAVFLGDGVVRGYPPDAVEHHQLEKLSDEHHLEEAFDRRVRPVQALSQDGILPVQNSRRAPFELVNCAPVSDISSRPKE